MHVPPPVHRRPRFWADWCCLRREYRWATTSVLYVYLVGIERPFMVPPIPKEKIDRDYERWFPTDEEHDKIVQFWESYVDDDSCVPAEADEAIELNFRLIHLRQFQAKMVVRLYRQ